MLKNIVAKTSPMPMNYLRHGHRGFPLGEGGLEVVEDPGKYAKPDLGFPMTPSLRLPTAGQGS